MTNFESLSNVQLDLVISALWTHAEAGRRDADYGPEFSAQAQEATELWELACEERASRAAKVA